MGAATNDTPGLDQLVEGGDPLDCPACLDAGDECRFHAGWAAGWDACAAFVADRTQERAARLAGGLAELADLLDATDDSSAPGGVGHCDQVGG